MEHKCVNKEKQFDHEVLQLFSAEMLKISDYYAHIMLNSFTYLLCFKLCWHNWLVPTAIILAYFYVKTEYPYYSIHVLYFTNILAVCFRHKYVYIDLVSKPNTRFPVHRSTYPATIIGVWLNSLIFYENV